MRHLRPQGTRLQVRLLAALIARNEAGPDRYLRRVLRVLRAFSDFILLVDDGSEDDTAALAREEGAWVVQREGETPMWGNEWVARKFLWDQAVHAAQDYRAWVLFSDADMELSADPRPLLATEHHNAWAWPLYDLWGADVYRADPPWQGHVHPRVWLVNPFRVPAGWQAGWMRRGLHAGHIPPNFPFTVAVAPPAYYWRHLAYATPEHRRAKHQQYLSRADVLEPHERQHAESILDGDDPAAHSPTTTHNHEV